MKCYWGNKIFKNYFMHAENLLHLMLPIMVPMISIHMNPIAEGKLVLLRYQYHMAGWGVFSTWILHMLYTSKVPKFGLYIKILVQVSKSFFTFVFAYIFVFMAFGFGFLILFPGIEPFQYQFAAVFVKVYCIANTYGYILIKNQYFFVTLKLLIAFLCFRSWP